ncbi:MAG: lytic transglycosylase domain-containing protein [Rhodobacteraceae bacterium]|nr:lytic transglycosylase domain-containing protein [Paracoccaceae bacterium]
MPRSSPSRVTALALPLLSGLLFTGLPSAPALAETPPPATTTARDPHAAAIAEAAARFAIPEPWIRAVIAVESAGDPRAVSHAGAMGLMQVMPGTWAALRQQHGLGDDPFDPRDNILAGTAYLRAMLDRYGNIGAMLAAYNAGPGRYDAYLQTGRPLPAETRAYVATLAPRLDGSAPPIQRATAPDWREAGLFVSIPTAEPPQAEGDPDAPAPQSETLSPAPASALFVARAGAEGAP